MVTRSRYYRLLREDETQIILRALSFFYGWDTRWTDRVRQMKNFSNNNDDDDNYRALMAIGPG